MPPCGNYSFQLFQSICNGCHCKVKPTLKIKVLFFHPSLLNQVRCMPSERKGRKRNSGSHELSSIFCLGACVPLTWNRRKICAKLRENRVVIALQIAGLKAMYSTKPCNSISFSNYCKENDASHILKTVPFFLWELKTEPITSSCADLDAFWESIDLLDCSI